MSDEDVTEITDPTGKLIAVATGDYQPRHAAEPITREQVAAKRGTQTWWQGLLSVVIVAIAGVLLQYALPADTDGWLRYGLLIAQAAVTAVASWADRRFRDGSGFEERGQ